MPWLEHGWVSSVFRRIWSSSKSETIALAFLFGALLTYPVVQFSVRHVFHLEFIWLMAMLALFESPFVIPALRRSAASLFFLTHLRRDCGIFSVLFLLRYQEFQLKKQFEAACSQPKGKRWLKPLAAATGELTRITLPVPPAHEALLHDVAR